MKQVSSFLRLLSVLTILGFLSQSFTFVHQPTPFGTDCELKIGDSIKLELAMTYTANELTTGNRLTFKVTKEVKVGGKPVINRFAAAEVEIIKKEKLVADSTGRGPIVTSFILHRIHIRASDGQRIIIDGPIELLSLEMYTPVVAYITEPITISCP